ncbi:MAG: excinuclease ABC subunit UvrA [Bacteroidaceae bacterium]|nr:excinuclease ABC subunit UvrA [Bacteroidaceae bacterium]
MTQKGTIDILGARVHNLKNVDVTLPRYALNVITGLSGSGKSSLAFDTIYAEGQRRYIETFSAYARNFLDHLERPDVDKVTGLSPVISIEQKTTNKNPRSTVGTVTEVYDFLRLLFARAADAYSYVSGERMIKFTEDQIVEMIIREYADQRVYLLAPLVRARKGHYRELFETTRKKGYLHVRVDGEMREIIPGMRVDRYKMHDIEVVVDRLRVQAKDEERLRKSVRKTMELGEGLMMVASEGRPTEQSGQTEQSVRYFSKSLMDPISGISYREPAPHNFSFNSVQGACPKCKGLGYVVQIDRDKVCPDPRKSIREGAFLPLGKYRDLNIFSRIKDVLAQYECDLDTPVEDLPEEAMDEIINGSADDYIGYQGLAVYIQQLADVEQTAAAQKWADQFNTVVECPHCHGARLNDEALSYRFAGKNIHELSCMDLQELYDWLGGIGNEDETLRYEDENLGLSAKQKTIAAEILKEIRTRLRFLLDVGLDYLSLSRSTATLSGGESQRIRLATQIGSQLVNVLYILDEPSIGLHQRDNVRLINSLKRLRDTGNTVIVVEHDQDMMLAADYIVDIGPRAGRKGGEVVFQGTPEEMLRQHTLTADYLNGERRIEVPAERRKGNGHVLSIKGAMGNNLKRVSCEFPLGTLICVTGVSGSGKSTLINDTMLPILSQHFYRSLREPLPYKSIEGLEHIDKVVAVDQSPIGRTPRSNPATYTGVFADIRSLFVGLPEAKARGYKPGRFSFNVKGGRCEVCKGNGYRTIEMNFLPDVYVPCEGCHGHRYNHETLEVRFKGKSISDVLDMTINQACEFFESVPHILQKIKVLQDVGLGYIKLGQASTTLSGGESQRVKLATELSKRDTGRTLYILDEPTTGLHFEDIRVLMGVLDRLVQKGNTVIVIEHNLDVIKMADHIIDMGPEGGRGGGTVIATGTPEQIVKKGKGYTAQFLKDYLQSGVGTNDK